MVIAGVVLGLRVWAALAGVAAGLAGGAALGQPAAGGPPMPVDPRSPAAMQRYMPAPTFVETTIAQDGRAPMTTRVCMDAATMLANRERLDAARPADGPPPGQGCTHRTERLGNGWTRLERTCDAAAGARYTSRSVTEIKGHDARSHTEQQVAATAARPAHTLVSDVTQRWLGACPAGVKPGQMVTAEGKVVDTAPLLARAAERERERERGQVAHP